MNPAEFAGKGTVATGAVKKTGLAGEKSCRVH